MSRSRKKAIIKDRPRNYKKSTLYWRKIRRVIKNFFKSKGYEAEDVPQPKEIINDYDYCDYIIDWEYDGGSRFFKKATDGSNVDRTEEIRRK